MLHIKPDKPKDRSTSKLPDFQAKRDPNAKDLTDHHPGTSDGENQEEAVEVDVVATDEELLDTPEEPGVAHGT